MLTFCICSIYLFDRDTIKFPFLFVFFFCLSNGAFVIINGDRYCVDTLDDVFVIEMESKKRKILVPKWKQFFVCYCWGPSGAPSQLPTQFPSRAPTPMPTITKGNEYLKWRLRIFPTNIFFAVWKNNIPKANSNTGTLFFLSKKSNLDSFKHETRSLKLFDWRIKLSMNTLETFGKIETARLDRKNTLFF